VASWRGVHLDSVEENYHRQNRVVPGDLVAKDTAEAESGQGILVP